MPLTRHERSVSPSGGSTLITSAPKSASCRVRMLPATRRDRSTTRTPFRGPCACGVKDFWAGFLANVLAEELQGARHRRLRRRRVVAAALVAVEAVVGGIVVDQHVGMGLAQLVHMRHRDVHVLVAEMHHGRHLWLLALGAVDAAAIVGRHRIGPEPGRRQPGDGAAPAVAGDRDLAGAALLQLLDRRLDVLDRLVEPELGHVLAALGDGVGRVAELDAGLDVVEEPRRQRQIAVGRELVGHRPDVMVDPEDLLDDDHAALGRAPGRGQIGADLAGLGLKTDIFTHEDSSRLRPALDMVMRRRSTGSPSGSESGAMYIPKHFEGSEDIGREIMQAHSWALLMTADAEGAPMATHLALLWQ